MSFFKILIGLAAVFALLQLIRIEDKYAKWLTVGMAISISLTLLPFAPLIRDGAISYVLVLFLSILYVFAPTESDSTLEKKSLMTLVFVIPMLAMLLELNGMAGVGEIRYVCSISVIAYLYGVLRSPASYKNEIGMLTIPATDAFIRLSAGIIDLL